MTQERSEWSDVPATEGVDDDAVAEVVVIEAEIEETRDQMTDTVDAIGAKLDPANIVQEAKETVRDATVGKVEQMANTAGQMVEEAGSTAQQAGAGLVDTIRRNPLPVALIGLGAGMLWMQRSNGQTSDWSRDRWATTGYGGYGTAGYGASGHGVAGSGSFGSSGAGLPERVGQTAGEAVGTVRQAADQAASSVGRTAEQTVQNVQRTGGQAVGEVQRIVEENPLAVGAVALAVGTAIGMALPTTRVEQRTLGQAGERLIGQAETAIEQPLQEMEQQARQG